MFSNDRHVQVSNQSLFQFRYSSNIDLNTALQNQVRNFLCNLVQELTKCWENKTSEDIYGGKVKKGEVISLEIGKLQNEWCLNLEIDSDRVLGFIVGPDFEKCMADLKAMALDTFAHWQHNPESDTQFGLGPQNLAHDSKRSFFKAI